jgi:hypothetical protein
VNDSIAHESIELSSWLVIIVIEEETIGFFMLNAFIICYNRKYFMSHRNMSVKYEVEFFNDIKLILKRFSKKFFDG